MENFQVMLDLGSAKARYAEDAILDAVKELQMALRGEIDSEFSIMAVDESGHAVIDCQDIRKGLGL